jgi:hypothetical protein
MATRHQKKAGPSSFSQRRGRRAATQQPIPKSPLAAKDEPATKTENEDSGSDCEDSNVIIDVTNVDSDEEEPHGDENENLDSKKEVVVVEGEKSDDIQVTSI